MKPFVKNKKGTVLPMTLVFVTVLMVIFGVFIQIACQNKENIASEIQMRQALYLADAGIELAMQELQDFSWDWPKDKDKVFHFDQSLLQEVRVALQKEEKDCWKFISTGVCKSKAGQIESKKILIGTAQRGLILNDSIPLESDRMDLEDFTPNIYYHKGNLALSGIYQGKWLVVVDGDIVLCGDVYPLDYLAEQEEMMESKETNSILYLICSGEIKLTEAEADGKKNILTVIHEHALIDNDCILGGEIQVVSKGDKVQEKDNAVFTQRVEEAFISFYQIILVNWGELYPVF